MGVLADSLLRRRLASADTRRAIIEGNVVPVHAVQARCRLQRRQRDGPQQDHLRAQRATLVVAADLEEGGTWAGAIEALRRSLAPVVVWKGDGAGAGNDALAERGAPSIGSLDELCRSIPVAGRGRRARAIEPRRVAT